MRKLYLAALVLVAFFVLAGASTAGDGGVKSYTVAFNQQSGLPANVDQMVAAAGGKITLRLPEIGGIGVESANPDFANAIAGNASVKAAGEAAVASVGPSGPSAFDASITDAGNNGGTYAPTGSDCATCMPDSLGYEQWDKKKLHATLAGSYAIQRGRRDVRVFVIDTGADQTHIDVAANLSPQAPAGDSMSFVPAEPTIQDFNGHGTWTISAVGGPINGVGISGVAPNVTLVAGKVLGANGSGLFLYTDYALVYAGLKHFDIVSASLGGFIPKCGAVNNPNQACDHPDYILLNRATQFARSNGVLPIASAGNSGYNLNDGDFFRYFIDAPAEVAGWVTVSATGYPDDKAFYSNYGPIDVAAPGGSTRNYTGVPGSASCPTHGGLCRLIGAWSNTATSAPSDPTEVCTGPGGTPPCYAYGYVQGTSMAAPNASGVAALIISQYGDFSSNNQNKPHMSPTSVESILQITANNQPCPEPNTVVQGPGFTFPTATCRGGTGDNSFFGKGIVDALNAITLHG